MGDVLLTTARKIRREAHSFSGFRHHDGGGQWCLASQRYRKAGQQKGASEPLPVEGDRLPPPVMVRKSSRRGPRHQGIAQAVRGLACVVVTKDNLQPSSRIDTSAPFHAELKAAFDGVGKAIAAVQKITESPDFPEVMNNHYGFIIVTTLKVEVDGLQRMAESAWESVKKTDCR